MGSVAVALLLVITGCFVLAFHKTMPSLRLMDPLGDGDLVQRYTARTITIKDPLGCGNWRVARAFVWEKFEFWDGYVDLMSDLLVVITNAPVMLQHPSPLISWGTWIWIIGTFAKEFGLSYYIMKRMDRHESLAYAHCCLNYARLFAAQSIFFVACCGIALSFPVCVAVAVMTGGMLVFAFAVSASAITTLAVADVVIGILMCACLREHDGGRFPVPKCFPRYRKYATARHQLSLGRYVYRLSADSYEAITSHGVYKAFEKSVSRAGSCVFWAAACFFAAIYPLGLFEPPHLEDTDPDKDAVIQISSVCLLMDGLLDDILFNVITIRLLMTSQEERAAGAGLVSTVVASLAISTPLLVKRVFMSYVHVVVPFQDSIYGEDSKVHPERSQTYAAPEPEP